MIPRTSPFPAAEPTPLSTLGWPAARLFECHPPRWDDHRKSAIFDDASSSGTPFARRVTFRRWSVATQLPDLLLRPTGARLLICPFHYPSNPPGCVEWHMNFADPSLFGFYGSSLFAQDEIQVAEHPALACVREALLALGSPARTTSPDGSPTPCTITGVERRCMIDFLPGDDLPDGLYGKNFARRDLSAILARTRPLHPPPRSNILAMAAPACGRGNYQLRELHDILLGAYTGFRAAALESALIDPSSRRTIIHTGLWGCGAFGGNPLVMVALQCLAADLAGVHPVFHASPADRAGEIRLGISLALDAVRDGHGCPQAALEYLEKSGFSWGHSDGN